MLHERGSDRERIVSIHDMLTSILAGPAGVERDAPSLVSLDTSLIFALSIRQLDGTLIPAEDITPGTYDIYRLRAGVQTQVVTAGESSSAIGRVYFTYSFPAGSWQIGDLFYCIWKGVSYSEGGNTYPLGDIYKHGTVVGVADVGTLSGQILLLLEDPTFGLEAIQSDLAALDVALSATLADVLEDTGTTLPASLTDLNNLLSNVTYGLSALKTLLDTKASTQHVTDKHTATDALIETVDTVVDAIKVKTDGLNYTGTDVKATLDGETVALTAGSLTASVLATDAISAAKVAADAVTKIQAGLAVPESLRAVLGRELYSNVDMALSANWSGTGSATVARSTEQAFAGTYSYKVISPGSNGAIRQDVPIVKGARYYTRAWVYPTTTEVLRIKLWDGVSGSTLQSKTCTANQWTLLEGFATATNTATGFAGVYMDNGGTFYVDQFSLRLVDGDEALLQRNLQALDTAVAAVPTAGSLNDIMRDGSIYPWDKAKYSLQALGRGQELTHSFFSQNIVADPSCDNLANFSATSVAHETTATRVRSSGRSLAFIGPLVVKTITPIRSNATYVLSYWIHDPNNAVDANSYFMYPQQGMLVPIQLNNAAGTYATNQWRQFVSVFNVGTQTIGTPTDATFTLDFGNTSTTVYIDDISLREVGTGFIGRGEYYPDIYTGSYTCTDSYATVVEITDDMPTRLMQGHLFFTAPNNTPSDDVFVKLEALFVPGGTWREVYLYQNNPATGVNHTFPPVSTSGYILQEGTYAYGWRMSAMSDSSQVHVFEYSFGAERKVR